MFIKLSALLLITMGQVTTSFAEIPLYDCPRGFNTVIRCGGATNTDRATIHVSLQVCENDGSYMVGLLDSGMVNNRPVLDFAELDTNSNSEIFNVRYDNGRPKGRLEINKLNSTGTYQYYDSTNLEVTVKCE